MASFKEIYDKDESTLEAANFRREPSVTSLTSADIDPQLVIRKGNDGGDGGLSISQQQQLQQQPTDERAPADAPAARSPVTRRLSMRRNTVPLVRPASTTPCKIQPPVATTNKPRSSRQQDQQQQQVCRYCLNLFDASSNWKGACPEAPDRVKSCVERLTCLTLADGVSYHCCADSEGDYLQPCQLGNSSDPRKCRRRRTATEDDDLDDDDFDEECGDHNTGQGGGGGSTGASLIDRLKAWSCVCLLAMFVPCLCCYPVCSLAHRGCMRMHVAGGRHAALWTTPQQAGKTTVAGGAPRATGGVKKDSTQNTVVGGEIATTGDAGLPETSTA